MSDPTERAYYRVCGPAGTTVAAMARVAGRRWCIEAAFEEAKGLVGLDQYEVRKWEAWHRHITLCLLAYAALGRHPRTGGEGGKGGGGTLIPLTVPETRRLLHVRRRPAGAATARAPLVALAAHPPSDGEALPRRPACMSRHAAADGGCRR